MDVTIGIAIRKARGSAHMSQDEVEKKTGIKRGYISKIENNKLKNPTFFTIARIADAIRINLSDLMQMVDTIDFPVMKLGGGDV